MRPISTTLSALAATLLLVAPASASETRQDRWAKSQGNWLGLEVDMLSTSKGTELSADGVASSVLATSFAVVGQFGPLDGFYLDVELPFAHVSAKAPAPRQGAAPITIEEFVLGNLTLGGHYADNLATALALFVGVSASLPLASDSSVASAYAAEYSSAARGFFDSHRQSVGHVPFRARGGAEVRLVDIVFVRADAGATLAIATGTTSSDTLIEQSDEVEVRSVVGLGGGLRFQAALPLSADDIAQAAVEPFVNYIAPEAGVYARIGYLVALDKPLGFGFDTGKVATIRFALGGKF